MKSHIYDFIIRSWRPCHKMYKAEIALELFITASEPVVKSIHYGLVIEGGGV